VPDRAGLSAVLIPCDSPAVSRSLTELLKLKLYSFVEISSFSPTAADSDVKIGFYSRAGIPEAPLSPTVRHGGNVLLFGSS